MREIFCKYMVAEKGIKLYSGLLTGHKAKLYASGGANIKTVASLLGHSGLKYTEKYTRAVDELKQKAINSLPELKM